MNDLFMYRLGQKRGGGGSGGGEDEWYITDASYLFCDGARLDAKDALLSKLRNVTKMKSMFQNCLSISSLDVSEWDTSNVTDMSFLFSSSSYLTELDVRKWNTSKVQNMASVFDRLYYIKTLDVSNWDTSSVTDMNGLFSQCTSVTELDVEGFNTSKVTNMANMFYKCSAITSLNLSGFDTSKVTNMVSMFGECSKLEEIVGFSATNKAGVTIGFPSGSSAASPYALKRLTFRTDLPDGAYSIRSRINIKYCSFNRDGMVEMFNTLPDVSGLTHSASYKTITITGNPCVTDGTLTAEDEAIATSKGWTLVK